MSEVFPIKMKKIEVITLGEKDGKTTYLGSVFISEDNESKEEIEMKISEAVRARIEYTDTHHYSLHVISKYDLEIISHDKNDASWDYLVIMLRYPLDRIEFVDSISVANPLVISPPVLNISSQQLQSILITPQENSIGAPYFIPSFSSEESKNLIVIDKMIPMTKNDDVKINECRASAEKSSSSSQNYSGSDIDKRSEKTDYPVTIDEFMEQGDQVLEQAERDYCEFTNIMNEVNKYKEEDEGKAKNASTFVKFVNNFYNIDEPKKQNVVQLHEVKQDFRDSENFFIKEKNIDKLNDNTELDEECVEIWTPPKNDILINENCLDILDLNSHEKKKVNTDAELNLKKDSLRVTDYNTCSKIIEKIDCKDSELDLKYVKSQIFEDENKNKIKIEDENEEQRKLEAQDYSNESSVYRETKVLELLKPQSLETQTIDLEKSQPEIESIELESPSSSPEKAQKSQLKSVEKNTLEILTIFPPPPIPGGISISVEDYKCLEEGEYLNDVIIDFYLNYLLMELLSQEDQDRTYVFSSHFFSRLTRDLSLSENSKLDTNLKQKRHEGVERWTKNVNIFDKDFIIIPINKNAHWFLVIICYPYLIDQMNWSDCSDFQSENNWPMPCILVLDSLSNKTNRKVIEILREYLSSEYYAKHQIEKSFSSTEMKHIYLNLPKQTNATDCGIFLLQYVESFFLDTINNKNWQMDKLKNWFDPSDIMHKRENIAKLITSLAKNFNKQKTIDLPELKFPKKIMKRPSEEKDNLQCLSSLKKIPKIISTGWISPRISRPRDEIKKPQFDSDSFLLSPGPRPLRLSLRKKNNSSSLNNFNQSDVDTPTEWEVNQDFKPKAPNVLNPLNDHAKTMLAMCGSEISKKKIYMNRRDKIMDMNSRKNPLDIERSNASKKLKSSGSENYNPITISHTSTDPFYSLPFCKTSNEMDIKSTKIPKFKKKI